MGFLFGSGIDFDPEVLKLDLMGLKGTNLRGECMIRPWVYMGLSECIWVSLRSFSARVY